jgi:hypothetical protein
MTRFAPLWQQGGTYPAATDRGLLGTLWPGSGKLTGTAPAAVANTMQVSIPAGSATVAMTSGGSPSGSELCRWDAAEVVTSTAAPPAGQSRIDLVVLQIRDNAIDGSGFNDFIFQVLAGAPTSGTPVAPAVPLNAMAVCQYTVPGGAANLNGVTVTDTRPSSALTASMGLNVTAGNLNVLGTARLGAGAMGANASYISLGQYDAANAIMAAANDMGANVTLLIQPKGTGTVLIRDSAAHNVLNLLPDGSFGFGTSLVLRWTNTGFPATRFDQVLVAAADSGGAGYRALIVPNGP